MQLIRKFLISFYILFLLSACGASDPQSEDQVVEPNSQSEDQQDAQVVEPTPTPIPEIVHMMVPGNLPSTRLSQANDHDSSKTAT